MNSSISPVVLTKEEFEWLDEQIIYFDTVIKNNKELSDYQMKDSYDNYFDGVYAMYEKYKTKHLTKFCMTGMEYDGYMPGNNANFIALYEELINMMRDKQIDKPIRYYSEIKEQLVLIEEDEEGNKTIITKR